MATRAERERAARERDDRVIAEGNRAYDEMIAEGWDGWMVTAPSGARVVVRSGMEGTWPAGAWDRFNRQADLVDHAGEVELRRRL